MNTAVKRQPMPVAVVGGGWAGISAAVELADGGIPVTLFEAAQQPGGRARTISWQGHTLDNGQHILLGAYRETLRLMHQVGADAGQLLLRLPLRLSIKDQLELRTPALPAPLHLLTGLLTARGLDFADRSAALRLMVNLRLAGFSVAPDLPLADFLTQQRQTARLTRLLWEPLCLAALNTPLHLASTGIFLNVLRDSFTRTRADSDFLLPRTDLSNVFPQQAIKHLQRLGAMVQTGTTVQHIRRNASGYAIHTAGDVQHFSSVIAAVSPWRLADIASELEGLQPVLHQAQALDYQPICTLYLQYPVSARLPFPMIGLNGGYAQWVLDRGALLGQQGLMAVVISAAGPHQTLSQEALTAAVSTELRAHFPTLGAARWHKVITEKRATFACRPGLVRPTQQTPLPGFYLAGDYTAGDYPATIEGAVRSGVKCARIILDNLGHPTP